MAKMTDTGVEKKSDTLQNHTFFYGVCGSIGAVDSVRQIREFRRHGARILPVMSPHATQFITPLSLEWASQEKVITELGPQSEHLLDVQGLIVCPATWNFLVEFSTGLCSHALATIAAIQLARRNPIFIVPTLNEEFLSHPLYDITIEKLGSFKKIFIYERDLEEGRMKMPEPSEFSNWVIQNLKSLRDLNPIPLTI